MNFFELDLSTRESIVLATIKGEILRINLASTCKNAYEDSPNIEYLGYGIYYSYSGTLATDKTKTHFWRYQSEKIATRIVMIEKY